MDLKNKKEDKALAEIIKPMRPLDEEEKKIFNISNKSTTMKLSHAKKPKKVPKPT